MQKDNRITMQPIKDNKKLYHIQSISDYSDEPMDYFIWKDGIPTEEDITNIVRADFEDEEDGMIEEIASNCNVYSVYAEEV